MSKCGIVFLSLGGPLKYQYFRYDPLFDGRVPRHICRECETPAGGSIAHAPQCRMRVRIARERLRVYEWQRVVFGRRLLRNIMINGDAFGYDIAFMERAFPELVQMYRVVPTWRLTKAIDYTEVKQLVLQKEE